MLLHVLSQNKKKKELKSNKVKWFLVEEQTLGCCLTFLGNVNLDLGTQWKGGLSQWMLYTDWALSNKSVKNGMHFSDALWKGKNRKRNKWKESLTCSFLLSSESIH